MNTIEKGNNFEDEVFKSIGNELNSNNLGILPSQAKLFKKKSYYSRDRNADIIVDISIEIWLKNSDNYSFLFIIECKDYSSSVPVSDLEEFKSKIDQIAGKNVKGIFATNSSFQRASLSYARSNGIGILRILPDDQIDWMVYLMTSISTLNSNTIDQNDYYNALTRIDYRGKNHDFYSAYDGYLFGNMYSLLKYYFKNINL